MDVAELERLFRTRVDDGIPEYLCHKQTFLDYLNEAQEEAAMRSCLLFEKDAPYCTLPVTSGIGTYKLDCAIFLVVRAELDGCVLDLKDRLDMDRLKASWRSGGDDPFAATHYDTTLEICPKPVKDGELKLETYRLPKPLKTDGDCPEIHRSHHRDLLLWCQSRHYAVPDTDIYDQRRADAFEKQFTAIFGQKVDADNKRDWFANTPHKVIGHT